jgi:glucose/arabinose dehydrogenase
MAFDPIGRLWVAERGGRIWIVDDEDPHGAAPVPFLDISDEVGSFRDHGMLGMVLDPRFIETGYVYVFYVVDRHHLSHCSEPVSGVGAPNCDSGYDPAVDEYFAATIGRITRYQAIKPNGEDDYHHAVAVDYTSRKVLVGETKTSGFPIVGDGHSVGTLLFGEDGTLLASFGDTATHKEVDRGGSSRTYQDQALLDGIIRPEEDVGAYRAQLVNSLNGKVVRIQPETGDGVPSNPFYDDSSPRSPRSRVWALGLRNPFRMTLRPQTGSHLPSDGNPGVLYIGDVGWENYEELNVAERAGLNFGWPLYEGMEEHYQQNGSTAYPDIEVINLDAPNPLFNSSGCTQEYFNFSDLIQQDTLSTLPLMNPCTGVDPIPSAIPSFTHRRPVISWFQDGDEARWSTYAGIAAEHPLIGQSNSAGTKTVTGLQFRGNSTSGGAWYTASEFPEKYRNTFFMGDFVGQWIRNIVLDDNNEAVAVREFDNDVGGVVSIAVHPFDGDLYYISWATFITKVEYAPTANQAPTAIASSDVNFGPSPLPIQFSSSASFDPEDHSTRKISH